ncbi:hypothetical protein L210DRAFT_3632187 [Boletus edulis BED1]|uniref:Uncharacterized protein n=1 Tax=Boletus edulis BED1 TaxID=1328754 RepID=A0AAD4BNN9_BOLED|nr:hypothetical protein L210DRAFT_3632187 [Boletus edulis BED1]
MYLVTDGGSGSMKAGIPGSTVFKQHPDSFSTNHQDTYIFADPFLQSQDQGVAEEPTYSRHRMKITEDTPAPALVVNLLHAKTTARCHMALLAVRCYACCGTMIDPVWARSSPGRVALVNERRWEVINQAIGLHQTLAWHANYYLVSWMDLFME